MRLHRPLTVLSIAVLATALSTGSGVRAQGVSVDGSDCLLLTNDEVAAAMGATVSKSTDDQYFCTWATSAGTVTASYSPVTLDSLKSSLPTGTATTVGAHDAWYVSDGPRLFVRVQGGSVEVDLTGAMVADQQTALTSLAQAAVAKVDASPSASAPTTSSAPATGLLALFPATVGGKPLGTMAVPPDQVASNFSANTPAVLAFLDGLDAQGKSDTDLKEAVGIAADGSVVFALQVAGADATPLAPLLAAIFAGTGPAPVAETIAGKSVLTVQATDEKPPIHVYASGDVIWGVQAIDPGLTEILTALH
jgi:hypothetical protein